MNAAKEGLYENIADQVGLKVAYEVRERELGKIKYGFTGMEV